MPINKNSFWVKFEEFGFYYRIKEGILKQAPISDDGTVDSNNKIEVTQIPKGIDSINFLNKINQEFGINFNC